MRSTLNCEVVANIGDGIVAVGNSASCNRIGSCVVSRHARQRARQRIRTHERTARHREYQRRVVLAIHLCSGRCSNRDWSRRNREVGRDKTDVVVAVCQRSDIQCICSNCASRRTRQRSTQRVATFKRPTGDFIQERRVCLAIDLCLQRVRRNSDGFRSNGEIGGNIREVVVGRQSKCSLRDRVGTNRSARISYKCTTERIAHNQRPRSHLVRKRWVGLSVLFRLHLGSNRYVARFNRQRCTNKCECVVIRKCKGALLDCMCSNPRTTGTRKRTSKRIALYQRCPTGNRIRKGWVGLTVLLCLIHCRNSYWLPTNGQCAGNKRDRIIRVGQAALRDAVVASIHSRQTRERTRKRVRARHVARCNFIRQRRVGFTVDLVFVFCRHRNAALRKCHRCCQ